MYSHLLGLCFVITFVIILAAAPKWSFLRKVGLSFGIGLGAWLVLLVILAVAGK